MILSSFDIIFQKEKSDGPISLSKNGNVGNARFEVFLKLNSKRYKEAYARGSTERCASIANNIVQTVCHQCVPRGRFLEYIEKCEKKNQNMRDMGVGVESIYLVYIILKEMTQSGGSINEINLSKDELKLSPIEKARFMRNIKIVERRDKPVNLGSDRFKVNMEVIDCPKSKKAKRWHDSHNLEEYHLEKQMKNNERNENNLHSLDNLVEKAMRGTLDSIEPIDIKESSQNKNKVQISFDTTSAKCSFPIPNEKSQEIPRSLELLIEKTLKETLDSIDPDEIDEGSLNSMSRPLQSEVVEHKQGQNLSSVPKLQDLLENIIDDAENVAQNFDTENDNWESLYLGSINVNDVICDHLHGDDIFCGRRNQYLIGNNRFKILLYLRLFEFNLSDSATKLRIIGDIIDSIKNSSPSGKFYKSEAGTKLLIPLSTHEAYLEILRVIQEMNVMSAKQKSFIAPCSHSVPPMYDFMTQLTPNCPYSRSA